MSLQVVGAGAGRTGTLSLKAALERLTGQPCYHMLEVFAHPEHVALWRAAGEGDRVDWTQMLEGYGATSDFPACLFWREILDANPGAVVVLSTRVDSESWWQSASQTIFSIDSSQLPPDMAEWFEMWRVVALARFTPDWTDKEAAVSAYERHNLEVRASVPADQLLEWRPQDGWGPLCDALRVEVPDEPFPHLNKREDFPRADKDISLSETVAQMARNEKG